MKKKIVHMLPERRKTKILRQIEQFSNSASELKKLISDRIQFQENINLDDINFIEKGKIFLVENKSEIFVFKSLQGNLEKLGFEDVFLSYFNKENSINDLFELIYKDKEIKELAYSLKILEKSINEVKNNIRDNFSLQNETQFEFEEMVKNINIFLPTIDAKNLKIEIDELSKFLQVEGLWQFFLNFEIDVNPLRDLILKYINNEEELKNTLLGIEEITNNLNKIINSSSNFLDIKIDSGQRLIFI